MNIKIEEIINATSFTFISTEVKAIYNGFMSNPILTSILKLDIPIKKS